MHTRMCAEFHLYFNDACTCMSGCLLGNHKIMCLVHPTTDCVYQNRLCVYICIWGLLYVEFRSFLWLRCCLGFKISLYTVRMIYLTIYLSSVVSVSL